MIKRPVIVDIPLGLHARPAANFVKLARSFQSRVTIVKGEEEALGTSIMHVLALAIKQGTEILLQVDGVDEEEALQALSSFLKNG